MKHSRAIVLFISICLAGLARAGLAPDQIALVVNRSEPKSLALAQSYAKARGIPDGRIIELDLATAEEISPEQFNSDVAAPVRKFLRANNLDKTVTCLVTFYGMPIRVGARVNSSEEAAELAHLVAEVGRVQSLVAPSVNELEKLAVKRDPGFRPISGQTIEMLARRADAASKSLAISVQRIADQEERQAATAELVQIMRPFSSPVPASQPTTQPSTALTPEQAEAAGRSADTPEARRALRESARNAGPFAYVQTLMMESVFLSTDKSDASLDSELSLLWWPAYPRAGWQPNPLNVSTPGAPGMQPVLMVSRLDAQTPEVVQRMIEASIAVEREGLRGRIVIDSRGIPFKDAQGKVSGFGAFDQLLRNLAEFVRTKTKLDLVFDDKPEVLPAEQPIDGVAIYFGWYSVEKYVPAMKFSRGAIGIHVASYTMTSLRGPRDGDWVRSLLNDGCVATFGAVSEPLLHAFNQPDEFIPLLLTGKLTLAEAYWKTNPLVSWKMTLIGDPLYTPFKTNPAMKIEDLTPTLQRAITAR